MKNGLIKDAVQDGILLHMQRILFRKYSFDKIIMH